MALAKIKPQFILDSVDFLNSIHYHDYIPRNAILTNKSDTDETKDQEMYGLPHLVVERLELYRRQL